MTMNIAHNPRLVISALRGGGGKTLLSLGLCRAFVQQGKKVVPFKKGPDYIDAHWLELAASSPCTNIDPYFLSAERLRALFFHVCQERNADLSVVEGNRGLFDGQDVQGSCSTAEVARILNAPVIISLDVTKMTRTSAALLHGLAHFEKDVRIGGVVLNQVGSSRHERIIREAIEYYTDIPVLGALPRLKENPLPERHMGLTQGHIHEAESMLQHLGDFIQSHCDLEAIFALACTASSTASFTDTVQPFYTQDPVVLEKPVRIGYIFDDAFWFYYAENLEALRRAGATLVPLSMLDEKPWPQDLQGLYIGGGYPEEYLEQLSASKHLHTLREFSAQNMPIYAECGGFMLLAQSIIRQGKAYAMADIFPVQAQFHARPQGLGYVQAQVQKENPYHPLGQEIRGHEFHYSKCVDEKEQQSSLCLHLAKGIGMGQSQDGLLSRQTFASYTHIFAPSCPWWAPQFVRLAAQFTG